MHNHYHTPGNLFLSLLLDHTSTTPLYQQLYEKLRMLILSGELAAATRLPSTRAFAQNLGISRATVLIAFEQLLYEGYVRGKTGSGTYVEDVLPDELLHPTHTPRLPTQLQSPTQATHPTLSRRGERIATNPVAPIANWDNLKLQQAFRVGIPALNEFPFKLWAQLSTRRWRNAPPEIFGYTNPAGYRPLRREIAAYVKAARGVHCEEEQVIIIAGSQQGLNLTAELLIDPGDPVWVEEACYLGARGALQNNGAQLIPVPVDQEGLNVTSGIARCPNARLAYVTPSHQFPLGTTMSLARRLALLQWAQQTGAWILEDDYDGEYRYSGRPIPSLQGLDTTGRVIYMGTFSKVLFPGLRLGYLVAPPPLVDAFITARASSDRHSHVFEQLVLTDFIMEEHFSRHVRRMRSLYAERQAILLEEVQRELSGLLNVPASHTGMHLVGQLEVDIPDTLFSRLASQQHVALAPLSTYYIEQPRQNGVTLGYTAIDVPEIRRGVQTLATILKEYS